MSRCRCVTASCCEPACCGRGATAASRRWSIAPRTARNDTLDDETTFTRAVERGYAVVVQDVRGRYRSDGEFRPYENEGRDGFDTIEWAAVQPWSDGNVGTFGLSYPGAVQWLAAMESPPHLKAMVPAMTFSTPQNFFFTWGVWDMSWIYWIWQNIAPDIRVKHNLPGPKTGAEARSALAAIEDKMFGTLPLDQLEELRDVAPYYYDWLRHPPEDPFWDFAELRGKYARTDAAVLNLSAWHDDNYGPEGATTNFEGLVKARGGKADRTALLIGPWVHGSDATARTKSGDREFGAAAAIDYDNVVLEWMDQHLRGKGARFVTWPDGALLRDGRERVEDGLRVAAAGEGHGRTSCRPPGAGRPTEARWPRRVPRPARRPVRLASDPDNPVINPHQSAGAHDYRALAERADVLTFDSEPLDRDTEITGPITARLFVSCDCRDTDIWARLLDVGPDGTAYNLMSPGLDVLRASYREMEKGRQLLTPGTIYELRLDHLITSNQFKRGHRVRLQISTSFFPNFSRNLHTGDLETTSGRRQRATIRIHHDGTHASHVVLPVVEE